MKEKTAIEMPLDKDEEFAKARDALILGDVDAFEELRSQVFWMGAPRCRLSALSAPPHGDRRASKSRHDFPLSVAVAKSDIQVVKDEQGGRRVLAHGALRVQMATAVALENEKRDEPRRLSRHSHSCARPVRAFALAV